MHEVEIEVVGSEVFERGVEGGFYIVRVVRVVPEFAGDEEVGTGDAGFLDGGAYGGFGAVDACCVDMAVAGFEGYGDCSIACVSKRQASCRRAESLRLLSVLVLPGPESNGRNLCACVECKGCAVVCHSDLLRVKLSRYL